MRTKLSSAVLAGIVFGGLSQTASATLLSNWSWSTQISAVDVSGTASFSVDADTHGLGGYDLTIVIDNTADQLPTSSSQILAGLYFDITPSVGALSMYSAIADLGILKSGSAQTSAPVSTQNTNVCAPGTNQSGVAPNVANCTVSGGWQAVYNNSGVGGGAKATQQYGIGTSGQGGVFNGNNVGGFDYGIAPGNGVGIDPNINGGSGGLGSKQVDPADGTGPGYVYGEVVYVLTGLNTSAITIANVESAYGTAPEGVVAATNITQQSLPEPSSATMLLAGGSMLLMGMGILRRRASRH